MLAQTEGNLNTHTISPLALPSGDSVSLKNQLTDWGDKIDPNEVMNSDIKEEIHLQRPIIGGYLSSDFGVRDDPLAGIKRAHDGIDIAAPVGTPVFAAEDGMVTFAGTAGDYGSMVQIKHRGSVQTRYGHLSRVLIQQGQPVLRGKLIGLVGSSGRSTGPHLHYEVLINGRPFDPHQSLPHSSRVAPAPIDLAPMVIERWQGWSASGDRLPAAFAVQE